MEKNFEIRKREYLDRLRNNIELIETMKFNEKNPGDALKMKEMVLDPKNEEELITAIFTLDYTDLIARATTGDVKTILPKDNFYLKFSDPFLCKAGSFPQQKIHSLLLFGQAFKKAQLQAVRKLGGIEKNSLTEDLPLIGFHKDRKELFSFRKMQLPSEDLLKHKVIVINVEPRIPVQFFPESQKTFFQLFIRCGYQLHPALPLCSRILSST